MKKTFKNLVQTNKQRKPQSKSTESNETGIEMPKRTLGKTGYQVSILSLGGQGALQKQNDEKDMVEIIQRAYKLGINYFDTSPVYGPSEDYYGAALREFRKKIFLASKTQDRTRDGSLRLLEKSLKRLKTTYLDSWQIHQLTEYEEINEVTAKNGALKAAIEMKEQGVVKYIGFTGHESPGVLVEMASRFEFDTSLCPVNIADRVSPPSFIDEFLPVANQQNLGVVGMKVFSQGYLFNPGGITTPWEALSYVLSLPVSTVIVGCDSLGQLEENVAIAKAFYKLSEEQAKKLEEKAQLYPERGAFFKKQFGGYGSKDFLSHPPFVVTRYNPSLV